MRPRGPKLSDHPRMMPRPDQRALLLGDLMQFANQGVDVRCHRHQHRRRQLTDRRKGVHCPGRYDDELAGTKSPYVRPERDIEPTGQHDEPFVAAIVNMQRSLRLRMRCQIPPPHNKVSHAPRRY
jgi:hypothetical protein